MRRLVTALCCLCLVLTPTLCIAAETPLRIGLGPEPETLDPHRGLTLGAARLLLDLCEGLLTRGADGRTIPGVASRWDQSADGLTWVFHLRPQARWWNGDPVTAADFVRGWRRAVDPDTASGIADLLDAVEGAVDIREGHLPPDRLGIQAADNQTLVVKLAHPTPDFDMVLAHRLTLPVHGPTLAVKGRDFATPGHLMCNGPYRLVEHRLQQVYRLQRSGPFHDRAAVAMDAVDFVVTDGSEAELALFRAGQLDATSTLPGPMVDWAQTALPTALRIFPWTFLAYLQANPSGAAWHDRPSVLEALALALDRPQMLAPLRGRAIPADRLVPRGLWQTPPADTPQDRGAAPEAARAALARAGYGPAAPPPRIEILYANAEATRRRAVAIAAQWKQVLGIDTDLVGIESRQLVVRARMGDFQGFVLNSWISYSPFYALLPFLPPGYTPPDGDGASQERQMQELERVILGSHLFIPISFGSSQRLVSPHLSGWQDNVYDIHPTRFLSRHP